MTHFSSRQLSLAQQQVDLVTPARKQVSETTRMARVSSCPHRPSGTLPSHPSCHAPPSVLLLHSARPYRLSLIALLVFKQKSLVLAKINTPAVQTSRRLVGIRLTFLICPTPSSLLLSSPLRPSPLVTSHTPRRCRWLSNLAPCHIET